MNGDAPLFSAAFRPLAMFLNLLGVFPLVNIYSGNKKLSFKLFSPCTVWPFVVLSGFALVDWFVVEKKVVYFNIGLYAFLFVFVLVHCKCAAPMIALVNGMDGFDSKSRFTVHWSNDPKRKTRSLVAVLAAAIWIVLTVTVEIYWVVKYKLSYSALIIGISFVIELEMLNFLYFYICYEIVTRYRLLNGSWRLANRLISIEAEIMVHVYERYRFLHGSLKRNVILFNSAFGLRTFLILCTYFIQGLVNVYSVVYHRGQYIDVFATHMGLNATMVYLIVILNDKLQKQMSSIAKYVLEIPLPKNDAIRYQIILFLYQSKENNEDLSAAGVISLNKGIFGSGIMLFITYLIALVQLQPQIEILLDHINKTAATKYH